MSKDVTVMVLGVAVAALPFLGFPSLWELILFVVLGLTIAFLTYLIRQDVARVKRECGIAEGDVYVENGAVAPEHSAHAKETEEIQ